MTRRELIAGAAALALTPIPTECVANQSPTGPTKATLEQNLRTHILNPWFPKSADKEHGGFHQTYANDWKDLPDQARSVVYQSRLTWVAATAMRRYPKEFSRWTNAVRQGSRFLTGPLHDSEYGGWYWEVGVDGKPNAGRKDEKHIYGISFAIYALARACIAMPEPETAKAALEGFLFLEVHAHDKQNGGYYEAFTRKGDVIMTAPSSGMTDPIGTKYGLKSMNSHIHMLEALTELLPVAPQEPRVRERLKEVFLIVRDKVVQKSGYLALYFKPDWTPVSEIDSFGHDIETAFLLVEAATALGMGSDAKTWETARLLVDHALKYGWDETHGGFYDSGIPNGKVTKSEKVWWTQAEGLNALKLMDKKYGKSTDKYRMAYAKQWEFIDKFQVDKKFGGWYTEVAADGTPHTGLSKSDAWKDPYHQGRALFRLTEK